VKHIFLVPKIIFLLKNSRQTPKQKIRVGTKNRVGIFRVSGDKQLVYAYRDIITLFKKAGKHQGLGLYNRKSVCTFVALV